MTRNGKFILAGVTLAALGLAAAGAVAHRGGHWDHGGWGHGGWRHHGGPMGSMGSGGLGFAGPMGNFCRANGSEMADHMLIHIEHKVKPTDAQKGAFEELKTAVKSAAEKMQAGCPKDTSTEAAKGAANPIERLAQAETGLEAALDALKTVRPAAEKFYAGLSDEQKAKVAEARGARHWRRGERAEDGPGDGTAPAPRD